MDPIELRPLTTGELLDRTFRLYRNHFWLFVGIMAIPSAISIPFSALIYSVQGPGIPVGRAAPQPAFGSILFLVVFFCLFWAVYSITIGAATFGVSEAYLGRAVTVRGSYGRVRGNFWRILGVVVVAWLRCMGILVLGGIGVAIIVGVSAGIMAATGLKQPTPALGIIFGVTFVLTYLVGIGLWLLWSLRYAVSIPALLLENAGVLAALRRSVQLTRGRRWHIFLAVLLSVLIVYAGVILFQGPLFLTILFSARTGPPPVWLSSLLAVSGAIGGSITGPVLLIVLVLCYYDTRIRKEAFDLQFMMSSLDRPAPAPGAASPARGN